MSAPERTSHFEQHESILQRIQAIRDALFQLDRDAPKNTAIAAYMRGQLDGMMLILAGIGEPETENQGPCGFSRDYIFAHQTRREIACIPHLGPIYAAIDGHTIIEEQEELAATDYERERRAWDRDWPETRTKPLPQG